MGADISREILSLRSPAAFRRRRAARRLADLAFDRSNRDTISAEGAIAPLVELMKSRDRECRSNAVFAIALLADIPRNRKLIVDEGGLPALVRLLAYGGDRDKAHAARTIGMIVSEDKNSKEIVRAEGGIPMLVRLLKSTNPVSTQQATMALANLTTTSPDATLTSTLSSEGGLIPLLRLLRTGDEPHQMWVTIIISHIAHDASHRTEIIKEGGIKYIVRQLSSNRNEAKLNAANALASLCEHDPEVQKTVASERGVAKLVTMLDDPNDVCREQSAFVLDIMSKNKDTYADIIRDGAVEPTLRLLDSDCEYCRINASCLLANLSCFEEGCAAIEEHGGAQRMLDLLNAAEDRTRWNAVCTLGNLGLSSADRHLSIVRMFVEMVCGFCTQLYIRLVGSGKDISVNESFNVGSTDTTPITAPPVISEPTRSHPTGPFEAKAKKSPKYKSALNVRDVYRLGGVIGSGGFATVRQATDRKTGEVFACKIMALPAFGVVVPDSENSREDIFKEIEILSRLHHKNIVGLMEFYFDAHSVYLLSELLKGGELLDAVLDHSDGYSEDIARSCFRQLMEGIHYLHENGVAHRDLKLENLLLVTKGDISNLKITDFGLAKLTQGGQMTTVVGTPQYVAPEIIQGIPGMAYSVAVDMWSAGVILFILLGGYPPFYAKSDAQLFDQIRNGRWDFDDPVWRSVSKTAKQLIARLLVVDASKRLTASETLEHTWLKDKAPVAAPLPLTHEKMRNTFDKWKKAYNLVNAVNKFKAISGTSMQDDRRQSGTDVQ